MKPIPEAAKHVTDTVADVVSSLGNLLDISLNPSSDETTEEAEFGGSCSGKRRKRGGYSKLQKHTQSCVLSRLLNNYLES